MLADEGISGLFLGLKESKSLLLTTDFEELGAQNGAMLLQVGDDILFRDVLREG